MTKNKNIIIATHVYATGPAQDLLEYLNNNKTSSVFFIGHPLFYDNKLKSSGYEIYKKGKLLKSRYKKIKKIPEPLSYLKDVFLNIYWVILNKDKFDLYIGNDNLNAFSGIILKWLGKVDKVVYYVIDYNPKRFENKILNYVYHKIDQFCVKYSDETWNLSPRMEKGRKKYFGFSGGNQKVVPIGIWYNRFERLNFSDIEKHTLVFMGHILEKQGVQYVLNAIPAIIKIIPDFKFLVIGDGEYLKDIKLQVENLNIKKYVEFTGFIENHKDVEKLLVKCSVAIAMYEKYDKNENLSFTYFADPGKIKSYLASGLPVLLSDASYNAKEIEKMKCGKMIDNSAEKIAEAVIEIMKNEENLQKFRKNAINYAKQFDWNLIFKKSINFLL